MKMTCTKDGTRDRRNNKQSQRWMLGLDPSSRRPDLVTVAAVSAAETSHQGLYHSKAFREAVKYPHLNLEDLKLPRPLLLLFDYRTSHNPDVERAHRTFLSLFHKDTADPFAGELPWADVRHAMASVSFSVREMYGSTWPFAPADLNLNRSIIVYELHLTSKVPPQ